jgi:glucose/arabinose dehydrogenase
MIGKLVQSLGADILAAVNTRICSAIVATLFAAQAVMPLRAAEGGKGFGLKLFAEGFVSPTTMAALPGGEGNLLVADQAGVIFLVGKEGKLASEPFLDLRTRLTKLNPGFDERGVLGLALHPKFAENKKFFVVYSAPRRVGAPENWDHTMRLSQFTTSANGLSADAASEKVILDIDQPYFNHNGGMIVFGADNYLYYGTGDGGNANDVDEKGKPKGRPPEGNGQNLQTLMGKILRIDVDKGNPYSVPQDNPFANKEAKAEIWAYGFRNPWRMSFDRGGERALFAADVGQNAYEEVDIVVKGGNYGWRIKEGAHCFDPANPNKAPADCPDQAANGDKLIDPILQYKNMNSRAADAQGISITGGYVYRGKALPQWQGKYIFGDWSRAMVKADGVLFAASNGANGKWTWERITPVTHADGLKFYITAFGEDADGELYVMTNDRNQVAGNTGKVFKIVPM